jgi:predicted adenylyl cyclase CyaB
MDELEVKVLNIERGKLISKLVSLGAKKFFDSDIETIFFDFKNGSLRETRDIMRLRRAGERIILTFKRFIGDEEAKRMDEYEVTVSDLQTMRRILEFLGLSVFESTSKHRTSYELDGTYFEFDKYKGSYSHIPEFLEIEAKDNEIIQKYAHLLGLKPENIKPWSTKDLMDYYASFK